MAKNEDDSDLKLDITSMIDVVFLLVIFFIMMPAKEMEKQLPSHLPQTTPSVNKIDPPERDIDYTVKLTSRSINDQEILTRVFFNQRPVCQFTTYSLKELNRIYELPEEEKNSILEREQKRDHEQFDPKLSPGIRLLISRMDHASHHAIKGKDTNIVIDATMDVPFKVVLAVLNAGTGAGYKNLSFSKPGQEIWSQPSL